MPITIEQLKKTIHRELTDASVKIFEKVGKNYEFRGTGFFITPDGYLLTAYHCVGESPDDIFVETHFDGQFKAVLDQQKSLRDLEYDIAVLKIDYKPNHYLPLGSVAEQHKTDQLVTTGYPAGDIADNQEIGIYFGTISRFRGNKIEMDAAKGPGHSGGPVYHYRTHQVIGLISAGYKPEIMFNAGLAVRFDPLFKKWREFEQINQVVAKAWRKRFQEKSPCPKKPLSPQKHHLKNHYPQSNPVEGLCH